MCAKSAKSFEPCFGHPAECVDWTRAVFNKRCKTHRPERRGIWMTIGWEDRRYQNRINGYLTRRNHTPRAVHGKRHKRVGRYA